VDEEERMLRFAIALVIFSMMLFLFDKIRHSAKHHKCEAEDVTEGHKHRE
jgi:hypothetical protein